MANPYLAAALATAVFTAASDTQLTTAHPTDLTADAATIALHDPDGLRYGCTTHPVPPWARPLLLAASYQHTIAAGGNTALFDSPFAGTGLPHLTDLAEACKLRPPQPPRNRPHSHHTRPNHQLRQTIWPLSNAHYRFPTASPGPSWRTCKAAHPHPPGADSHTHGQPGNYAA
ncbi:hypothetical protein [Kitasatospora sp. NPDC056531]|uniref:hypothetical protein n=1 Tax=Kitasatospora sp. NPDC056531 TaxID=3345856 RepID=UPI0036838960